MSAGRKHPEADRPVYHDWREKITATIDPLGVFVPLLHAQLAWALHPLELLEHMAGFGNDLLEVGNHATAGTWEFRAKIPWRRNRMTRASPTRPGPSTPAGISPRSGICW